jgi:hypothetical protein
MIATSWQFLAVQAPTASGFVWYWRRQRAAQTLTSKPFPFYFECIADARRQGYAGTLPAGPKTPLHGLPNEPIAGQAALAKPRATDEAAHAVLSIRPLAAPKATRRRVSRVE